MPIRWRWTLWLPLVLLAGCAPGPRWRQVPAGVPVVRVLLAEEIDRVVLGADGAFRVAFAEGGDPPLALGAGETVEVVTLGAGRVSVVRRGGGTESQGSLPVHVIPDDPASVLLLDGQPYRGRMELGAGRGSILVINAVDVESYLQGVVPAEIGYLTEDVLEAVKAQAVAARTYALRRVGNGRSETYDLLATTADQVYRGKKAEHPLANRAIRETRGVVAVYHGTLIHAYYSAACGGRTAAIRDVWEREDAPYLRGVQCCGQGKSEAREAYCRFSPYFEWTVNWEGGELERILTAHLPDVLGKKGMEVGEIQDLRVRGHYRCGRAKWLEIRTTRGTHKVWGDRIRWVLRQPGSEKPLWSTKFSLKVNRSRGRIREVVADGRGFGHGVGLCQEGAIQMAREGKQYEQILKHYYSGIRLDRILYEPNV